MVGPVNNHNSCVFSQYSKPPLSKGLSQEQIFNSTGTQKLNSPVKKQPSTTTTDKVTAVSQAVLPREAEAKLKKDIQDCYDTHNAAPNLPKLSSSITSAVIDTYLEYYRTVSFNGIFNFACSTLQNFNESYRAKGQIDRRNILNSLFQGIAQKLCEKKNPLTAEFNGRECALNLLQSLPPEETMLLEKILTHSCIKLCCETFSQPTVFQKEVLSLATTVKQVLSLHPNPSELNAALFSYAKVLNTQVIAAFKEYHDTLDKSPEADLKKEQLYNLVNVIPMFCNEALEHPKKKEIVEELEAQLVNEINLFSKDLLERIKNSESYSSKARAVVNCMLVIKNVLDGTRELEYFLSVYYIFEDIRKCIEPYDSFKEDDDIILKSMKAVFQGLLSELIKKIEKSGFAEKVNLNTTGDLAALGGLNKIIPIINQKFGFRFKMALLMKTTNDELISQLNQICPKLKPEEIQKWTENHSKNDLDGYLVWLKKGQFPRSLYRNKSLDAVYQLFNPNHK